MTTQLWWQGLLLAFALVFSVQPTVVAQQPGKITVTGKGEISAPADQLVIVVYLTKKGKTVAEAAESFAEARKKLTDSLNPMDFSGVEINSDGKSISEPQDDQMMGVVVGMPGDEADAAAPQNYAISETLRIKLPHESDQLADLAEIIGRVEEKVVSVSGKLGKATSPYVVGFGGAQMAYATISNQSDAESAAWKKALENAKQKAQSLASLSGLRLGKIVSVKESEGSPENMVSAIYGMGDSSNQQLGDIKVSRQLVVEFEAASPPE